MLCAMCWRCSGHKIAAHHVTGQGSSSLATAPTCCHAALLYEAAALQPSVSPAPRSPAHAEPAPAGHAHSIAPCTHSSSSSPYKPPCGMHCHSRGCYHDGQCAETSLCLHAQSRQSNLAWPASQRCKVVRVPTGRQASLSGYSAPAQLHSTNCITAVAHLTKVLNLTAAPVPVTARYASCCACWHGAGQPCCRSSLAAALMAAGRASVLVPAYQQELMAITVRDLLLLVLLCHTATCVPLWASMLQSIRRLRGLRWCSSLCPHTAVQG